MLSREQVLEAYICDIEELRLPRLREAVALYAAGRMKTQVESAPGQWVDDTDKWAKRCQSLVVRYEGILSELRSELAEDEVVRH